MIAGRDTVCYLSISQADRPHIINLLSLLQTAGLLTFVIYLLSQHPNILARLREEILSQVGSTKHPTPEDLREMKFLRAVINGMCNLHVSRSTSD